MTPATYLRIASTDFLSATQFLTRIPVPSRTYDPGSLARAVKFFPLVGAIVGVGAALLHLFLTPHLPRMAAALGVLIYQVLITGALHEDALADAADGFGGGTSREKILLILHDSRIGSYGGLALAFSLFGRVILISSLPLAQVSYYLIVASILCRWTPLPLSYFLSSAHESTNADIHGQGARIASHTSIASLLFGTISAFAAVAFLLRAHATAPILAAILITWLTGMYYKKRIGGITGDCFGATIQLSEICVYLCGAWIL